MMLLRYAPDELLTKYRTIRAQITREQFFRSPEHKKTQEMWCAAHFARAYNQHVAPCTALISDKDEQTDADFFLDTGEKTHPFQITERMEPARRRGDEYRWGESEKAQGENWSKGTEHGSAWVRLAIERKLMKKYAGTAELNLLVYLNFAAHEQQYEDMRSECVQLAPQFASVWLLNGNALCCIHQNPVLRAFQGWMMIPESLVHSEP